MNLEPWEIFIVTGIKPHDDEETDELTYNIKTTQDGYETWLFEKDIVVLCEP